MGRLSVQNLGKAYKYYPSRWSRLLEWMIPGSKPKHSLKWVLQDVSFTVEAGEALGIIGINGAGKSTLLKMITGTTQPTTGTVHVEGKVAAMLELGMGFHPDFTGRQNIYMAGQLLGMSLKQITQLLPDIEAFAEIGDYLDHPVRIYSSGMQMRLAFSVATAVRPDVLIVDEALSVGDAYFQHKSFARIREYNKQGTTLLMVSHDKQSLQSICGKAILLNAGKVAREGTTEVVMDYYNALLAQKQNQKIEQIKTDDGKTQIISGTGEAKVKEIYLQDEHGKRVEYINVGQRVILCAKVQTYDEVPRLVMGYGIKDRLGQVVYGTNTDLKNKVIENLLPGQDLVYQFSFDANLGPGSYSVQTALTSTDTHLVSNYEWRELALIFHVVNVDKAHFSGMAWLDPEIGISM